ncbi:hypothetical protein QBC41DRAFT_270247 [Cercophora samala]|uniref:Uncharacterized protein n=1 Tax=Cercophora samala TaxID=330535 RepID=A0AA39ZIA7_9PEZI|nr:hypothetical protein QBC41DRAFT_270247 [Cercophora samala]
MLHNIASPGAEPSSSADHRFHSLGYRDHGVHRRSPPKSPSPVLNDPPAGVQTSHRTPQAVEYPDYNHLLRIRELQRQQAEETRRMTNQQQWAHYWQAQQEKDLAKALENSFITETAHRLFLKNKEREEDRVRKAHESFLKEQHLREADRAREQFYIDQHQQHEKEKMERRQRRKDRKAQQQHQQHQHQRVSFATPPSSATTSAPAPVVTSPTSTYASLTSSSNSTEEISNPENRQLQRLERRFHLRRPSPDNDNPTTGRELYQNPFMEPASRAYYYSPPSASPTGTTSSTISLSTLPPQNPVSSSSYLRYHSDKEKQVKQQEKGEKGDQENVKEWLGARERGRYRSSSHFRRETRRSRSRSRAGPNGDGYRETVWEREERETKVAADKWSFEDGEDSKGGRGRLRGRGMTDKDGKMGAWGEWEVYRDF